MRNPSSLAASLSAIVSLCALGLCLAGCADSVDTDPGGEAGGGGSTGSGVVAIAAPVLLEVAPLSLVLKITWESKATCDFIEGERRTATSEYAVVFEAEGTDTVYVDPEATEDQTYTYRLRCGRGEAFSDYSNEKTGNPMKL